MRMRPIRFQPIANTGIRDQGAEIRRRYSVETTSQNTNAARRRHRKFPKLDRTLDTNPKLIRRLRLVMREKVIRSPPVKFIPAAQLIAKHNAQPSQSHPCRKPSHHAQRFVLAVRLNNGKYFPFSGHKWNGPLAGMIAHFAFRWLVKPVTRTLSLLCCVNLAQPAFLFRFGKKLRRNRVRRKWLQLFPREPLLR